MSLLVLVCGGRSGLAVDCFAVWRGSITSITLWEVEGLTFN